MCVRFASTVGIHVTVRLSLKSLDAHRFSNVRTLGIDRHYNFALACEMMFHPIGDLDPTST